MKKVRPEERIDAGFRELMYPGLPDRFDGHIYEGNNGERALSDLASLAVDTAQKLQDANGSYEAIARVVATPLPPGIGEAADW